MIAEFGAVFAALYVGHHVGDYWVQSGHQAGHKGDPGHVGRAACTAHVLSYLATQFVALFIADVVLDLNISALGLLIALIVSGATHYMADRREHGLMFWLIDRIGRRGFVQHAGIMRPGEIEDRHGLASGGWALDQSWHLFWGVFVAGLIAVTL